MSLVGSWDGYATNGPAGKSASRFNKSNRLEGIENFSRGICFLVNSTGLTHVKRGVLANATVKNTA